MAMDFSDWTLEQPQETHDDLSRARGHMDSEAKWAKRAWYCKTSACAQGWMQIAIMEKNDQARLIIQNWVANGANVISEDRSTWLCGIAERAWRVTTGVVEGHIPTERLEGRPDMQRMISMFLDEANKLVPQGGPWYGVPHFNDADAINDEPEIGIQGHPEISFEHVSQTFDNSIATLKAEIDRRTEDQQVPMEPVTIAALNSVGP